MSDVVGNLKNEVMLANQKQKDEIDVIAREDIEASTAIVDNIKAFDENVRYTSHLARLSPTTKRADYMGENKYVTIAETKCSVEDIEDDSTLSLVIPSDSLSCEFEQTPMTITPNRYANCGLWDFGGRKEYYATHQAFLTSSTIHLVVADVADDIAGKGVSQYFADFQNIGGILI